MSDPSDPGPPLPPPPHIPPTVPGNIPPTPGSDGLANASLVLGIVGLAAIPGSLCLCPGIGFPFSVSGLVCALVTRNRSGIRTAGLITSLIGLGISTLVLLYAFAAMFIRNI